MLLNDAASQSFTRCSSAPQLCHMQLEPKLVYDLTGRRPSRLHPPFSTASKRFLLQLINI